MATLIPDDADRPPEADRPPLLDALDLLAVFDAAPGVNLLLAADAPRFTMLLASEGRLEATMTTRADTLGRPLFEVFPDANPENPQPSGVDNLRCSLETVLRTRQPHRMDVQRYDLRRADGSWEELYWSPLNTPVLGADGVFASCCTRSRMSPNKCEDDRPLPKRSKARPGSWTGWRMPIGCLILN